MSPVGVERLLSLFPEYSVDVDRPWSTAAGERRHWQSLIDVSEVSDDRAYLGILCWRYKIFRCFCNISSMLSAAKENKPLETHIY